MSATEVRVTTEQESRQVAEQARQKEWEGRAFLREIFLGQLPLARREVAVEGVERDRVAIATARASDDALCSAPCRTIGVRSVQVKCNSAAVST